MNREDIIRMAREAGAGIGTSGRWLVTQEELERFAALIASRVAAAERKRSEQEMSMMSEHCAELILIEREKVRSSMKKAFRRMASLIRADEREACAKVCDSEAERKEADGTWLWEARRCAAAIRARGQA